MAFRCRCAVYDRFSVDFVAGYVYIVLDVVACGVDSHEHQGVALAVDGSQRAV